MNPQHTGWDRLVAAARRAPVNDDTAAPYGFATRVAALAFAQERTTWSTLFARFSWRALGFAGLVALLAVATTYTTTASAAEEDVLSDETTVAVLFDVS